MSAEARSGTVAYRITEDGVELTLYPMIMGQVRLCVGEPDAATYDKAWCFHSAAAAAVTVATWDGVGDKPPGPWYRDLQTGERREFDADGNVVREWVQR